MSKEIDKILKKLNVKSLNALSKFSESKLNKLGRISKKEMATIYSSLIMKGLRFANETTKTPANELSCNPICNYEVIQKKGIGQKGQVTTVRIRCTEGNRILGGGYNILTPILPTYSSQGLIDAKPKIIVLQNGPGCMEYVVPQGQLRHLTAVSWVVSIYFEDFDSSPNLPNPEVWVYAIAGKANEATSGAGYFDPYDPNAFNP